MADGAKPRNLAAGPRAPSLAPLMGSTLERAHSLRGNSAEGLYPGLGN